MVLRRSGFAATTPTRMFHVFLDGETNAALQPELWLS
jgi:hypothetical protein